MERVMSELATFFCNKPEIEVHLVMYGIKPEVFYSIPHNLKIHKPHFIFNNNNKRIRHSIKTLFFLRSKIKQINPSSILSFGEYWNSFVMLALLGLKFPVFVSDRCQPNKSLGNFHDILRKLLYPNAAGVIVQTEKALEIYKKLIPNARLSVIGNPIRIINTGEEADKENIVLSVGRLIKSKHHDELIRLFVQIDEPGWKLIIIGDDAIKQKNKVILQSLIQELKAEDKVILTGSINDIDSFYIKSKIFAFTSSSEGFPNVIGEAMSAGLPVIAFDCIAGPSEMIEDGVDGFLVPTLNYQIFEEKLKALMKDEELRLRTGIEAKKNINRFDVDKIGEKYYHYINRSSKLF